MLTLRDRKLLLESQTVKKFTGIDFVQVDPDNQTRLRIFFVVEGNTLVDPITPNSFDAANFDIRNATDPNEPPIRVTGVIRLTSELQIDPVLDRRFLEIMVEHPGGFSDYRLRIDDPHTDLNATPPVFSRIDPFFNNVLFSFKAGCEKDQDCAPPDLVCPPNEQPDFPIDYLARDFVSLRNALLDYAAQRYPEWTLPIEADVGGMLAEVMAALGDEFSYVQDRFAREAFLETATQRRSLRRKARLLDFEIHDGRSARTLLDLLVHADGSVPTGSRVWARPETGPPIAFEVGQGLKDPNADYAVFLSWNAGGITPYVLDSSQACLQVGATEMFIEGTLPHATEVEEGQLMLLHATPDDPSLNERRHFVRLLPPQFTTFVDPLTSGTVTKLVWDPRDRLPFQIDQAFLKISLNVVPATAGERRKLTFVCAPTGRLPNDRLRAVEREGPLPSPVLVRKDPFVPDVEDILKSDADRRGEELRSSSPEVKVEEVLSPTSTLEWPWRRSLLGAGPADKVFTLDDGIWRPIVTFRRAGDEFTHQDYATGRGFTVRFGDGEFGAVPASGTVFEATYRSGPGARANVPADSITALEVPNHPSLLTDLGKLGFVDKVTNPLAVTDGFDPESEEDIKQFTPEAFKADVLFAVRPDDYGEQAAKLDFVQRAQGTPRWTGSWTTMFVSGDPFGSFTLTPTETAQLEAWMDCVRQAGRDVVVKDPKTLPIDLVITICVEAFAHPAQVLALVEHLLLSPGDARMSKGFFHPDNFTFGTPLRRSALEAVIHDVPGVRSVSDIQIRERGVRSFRSFDELLLEVDPDQVIRLDNDPQQPGNGTLRLIAEGGA